MNEPKQMPNKYEENTAVSSQPYTPKTTHSSTEIITEKKEPTIQSAGKGMNPLVSRALVGGLVGATLGTLAGVLAGKRATKGINHAAKGIGEAAKTVAGGVSQTAIGLGNAAKSVAEGVNYAVVGAVQDTAEGVNQVVGGALEAVKGTAEGAKQSVEGGLDAVKDTVESAKQSVAGGLDAVKDTAQDLKPSDDSSIKVAKERRIIDNSPVKTSDLDISASTSDTSTSIESDRQIDQTMSVPEISMASGEGDILEGQGFGRETFSQTGDI